MEQHGKNPRQNVIAVIPARFQSTRLESKLLLPLDGQPLILHTLARAKAAKNISRVIVATDDERILQVVQNSGNEAVLTSSDHQSGSDRIAEVAETLPEKSIIVNVQGDEPLIPPATIEAAVEAMLADETADIATTGEKFTDAGEILNPNNVKILCDENNYALYFSRSPVPFPREAVNKFGSLENALRNEPELISLYRKHTGLYVYRREFLLEFTKMAQGVLEKTEMLEQLRALENGAKIKVVEVSEKSIGVDTQEDFERVKALIENRETSPENEEFKLRRAGLNDLPALAKVYIRSAQISYKGLLPQDYLDTLSEHKQKEDFWQIFLRHGYQIFLAESSQGEIIGYVDFEEMPKGIPFDSVLNSLYVLPEYQRKGVGGKLFARAVEELNFQGSASMVLESLEVSPFKSFYEKKGGEVVGFSHRKLLTESFKTLVYGWKDLNKCRVTG